MPNRNATSLNPFENQVYFHKAVKAANKNREKWIGS